MVHLFWLQYTPTCFSYDYEYFQGAANFRVLCNLNLQDDGQIPHLPWKSLLPPQWYKAWMSFLDAIDHNKKSYIMDERVLQISPNFIPGYNRLPFRTLSKDEVVQASGVTEHMASVLSCAKYVSEATVRNISGNSFHPQLIEAALGSSDDLKAWITGPSLSNGSRAGMPAPDIIVKKFKLLESSSSELNSLVISKAKAKAMPKYRRIQLPMKFLSLKCSTLG